MSSTFTCDADAATAAFGSGVDALLEVDLAVLDPAGLVARTAAVEAQRRRLEVVDQRLIAELEDRRVAGDYARSSTAELLVRSLRVDPREAKARVSRARDLGPRRDFTGLPLQPIFPRLAEAMAAGEVSVAHARVVIGCIEKLPSHVAAEMGPWAEQTLVDTARHVDPDTLMKAAARIMFLADQDGPEPDSGDEDRQKQRGISTKPLPNGMTRIRGDLTPEAAEALATVLDPLAAPQPAEDGTADPRTHPQRCHDGLLDMLRRLIRSDTLPDSGGTPATILVTMTLTELTGRLGLAGTAHGGSISVAEALRLAVEADIIPCVLNDAGGIMAYGRTRRAASKAQRRALAARDRGCSFPCCTRPAGWTEAHHVIAWLDGGPTDLDNLTLLCSYHHRVFERLGWTVIMTDGVPRWIPPRWIDPERQPRRNTAHHLPEYRFDLD